MDGSILVVDVICIASSERSAPLSVSTTHILVGDPEVSRPDPLDVYLVTVVVYMLSINSSARCEYNSFWMSFVRVHYLYINHVSTTIITSMDMLTLFAQSYIWSLFFIYNLA